MSPLFIKGTQAQRVRAAVTCLRSQHQHRDLSPVCLDGLDQAGFAGIRLQLLHLAWG